MYVEATPMSGAVVNKKVKSDADKLERRFRNLDRNAQAYLALWEHGDFSPDAIFLFQYLLNRQGNNTHAFPKVREFLKKYKWNHRRFVAARDELSDKLGDEVFEVVDGSGKRRDSYYLKHYRDWPFDLCYRLWFPSVPNVGMQCVPNVGTPTPFSDSNVETLHGNSNGDNTYGTRESEVKGEECCEKCGRRALFYIKGHGVCDHGTECHQELWGKYGMV